MRATGSAGLGLLGLLLAACGNPSGDDTERTAPGGASGTASAETGGSSGAVSVELGTAGAFNAEGGSAGSSSSDSPGSGASGGPAPAPSDLAALGGGVGIPAVPLGPGSLDLPPAIPDESRLAVFYEADNPG